MNLTRVRMKSRRAKNNEAVEEGSTKREVFSDVLLGFGAALALGALFVLAYLSTQYQAFRNPYFVLVLLLCIILMAIGGVMLICGRIIDR
ncbi:MAG: hypothetical protein U1D67_06000 [Dehalococcoidia bacterium]|nr:hypothetical protein [Dehalococcoidia bacterium]MDZ4246651.1 hypothetical protein [Dehalococcoidia bacterium]